MIKKMLLSAFILSMLVGCGPKEPKQENEQTTTEQTTEAPKQKEKDTSKFDIFAQKNYEEFKFNASGA